MGVRWLTLTFLFKSKHTFNVVALCSSGCVPTGCGETVASGFDFGFAANSRHPRTAPWELFWHLRLLPREHKRGPTEPQKSCSRLPSKQPFHSDVFWHPMSPSPFLLVVVSGFPQYAPSLVLRRLPLASSRSGSFLSSVVHLASLQRGSCQC